MVAAAESLGDYVADWHRSATGRLDGLGREVDKIDIRSVEANGAIDQINLNLAESEWLQIDQLCSSKKARLVIAFSSSSILAA